jgi:hypothetical protein
VEAGRLEPDHQGEESPARYGHHRAVHFKLPISTDQVDAYQSAPGYFNDNACSVNATITTTFGRVRG